MSFTRFSMWGSAVAAALLLGALTHPASAAAGQRQHRIRWIPAAGDPVDEYRVYLGDSSGTYTQVIPIQTYQVDAQGVAHVELALENERAYFIAMTSLRGALESSLSNEIYLSPLLCPADQLFCFQVSFPPGGATDSM
jgi:hypothetical protein